MHALNLALDFATIDTPHPGTRVDGAAGGRGEGVKATLFSNVSSILDCKTVKDVSEAYFVSSSTAGKWRNEDRIPLRYLAPILTLVSWEELSQGSIEGTIHAGRGYTREVARACRRPDEPGPVLLQFRTEITEVIARVRLITQASEYRNIGKSLNANENLVATWVKRGKIPDNVLHRICSRYAVSLSWLMTGSGDRPDLKVPPRRSH